MAIGDLTALPDALANIVQQNTLARLYLDSLRNSLAYARQASWIPIPARIGATYTFTRLSELGIDVNPLDPKAVGFKGLDNNMTSDSMTDEQFTYVLKRYGKTFDVDLLEQKAAIKDYTMDVAAKQGRQAGRTREALCRNKLTDAYMGGNTIVTSTVSPTTTSCTVDDVRGFQKIMKNGVMENVSNSTGLKLAVLDLNNGLTYMVNGVTVDGTNVSSAAAVGGKSGVLNFDSNTAPAAGHVLKAVNASEVMRPNGKSSTQQLALTDLFNTGLVMNGKQKLAARGIDPMEDGWYRCIIAPTTMTQLYQDPDFKLAAQGQLNSPEFRYGKIVRYQGVEYIETTEAIAQAAGAGNSTVGSKVNVAVNRPILLGRNAITRGDFEGLDEFVEEQKRKSTVHDSHYVDGIHYILRSPMDRLGEIFSMTWQMINDYCPPSNATSTPDIIPTTDFAQFKNAIQFEHAA